MKQTRYVMFQSASFRSLVPRSQISWLTGYVLGIPKNGPGRSMTKVGYSFSGENYIFMVVIHLKHLGLGLFLGIDSFTVGDSKDFY